MSFSERSSDGQNMRSFHIHDVTHFAFGNENFMLVLRDHEPRNLLLIDLDAPANVASPMENAFQLHGSQVPVVSASPNGADYLVVFGLDDSSGPAVSLVGPKLLRTDNGRAMFAGPHAAARWAIGDSIAAHINAAAKDVTLTDSHGGVTSNARTVGIETGILRIGGGVPFFPTTYIGSDNPDHQQHTAQKTITNAGYDCLQIVSITSSDRAFSISRINGVPASYPVELCPAGFSSPNTATLEILFRPTTPGNHTTTFTITTDAQHEYRDDLGHVWLSPSGNTFQCSGHADVASVQIDALTRLVDFGNTPDGQTKHRQIVLRNFGEKNCQVTLGKVPPGQPFAWDDAARSLAMGEQQSFDCSFTPRQPGPAARPVDDIRSEPAFATLTYVPQLRGTGTTSAAMRYSPTDYLRLLPAGAGVFVAHIDIEDSSATEILHAGIKVTGRWASAFNLFVTTRDAAPPNPAVHDRHLHAYPKDARNYSLWTIQIMFDPRNIPLQRWRPHALVIYDHNASNAADPVAIPLGF